MQRNASIPQIALAWIVSHNGCFTAIPAALNPREASENAEAAKMVLSSVEMRRIEEATPSLRLTAYFFDHFLVTPDFMVEGSNKALQVWVNLAFGSKAPLL